MKKKIFLIQLFNKSIYYYSGAWKLMIKIIIAFCYLDL